MSKFHSIRVADVDRETKDCTVITFDIQHELQDEFRFEHGQHLTFRTTIDGQEVRRSYSLCTSPAEKCWKVAVKKIDGGLFSNYVNSQLKAGDVVEVMAPTGVFRVAIDPSRP